MPRKNPEDSAQPGHIDRIDAGLQEVWSKLGDMSDGFTLYGGAALALYLDHREPTELTWGAHASRVAPQNIDKLAREKRLDAKVVREAGMIVCTVAASRKVRVTFMEVGGIIPEPVEDPRTGPLGTPVASPLELVRSKLMCIETRTEVEDYFDLAEAERKWPGIIERARQETETALTEAGWTAHGVEPPPGIAEELTRGQRETLQHAGRRRGKRKASERE